MNADRRNCPICVYLRSSVAEFAFAQFRYALSITLNEPSTPAGFSSSRLVVISFELLHVEPVGAKAIQRHQYHVGTQAAARPASKGKEKRRVMELPEFTTRVLQAPGAFQQLRILARRINFEQESAGFRYCR
jgi:hypothetical protein